MEFTLKDLKLILKHIFLSVPQYRLRVVDSDAMMPDRVKLVLNFVGIAEGLIKALPEGYVINIDYIYQEAKKYGFVTHEESKWKKCLLAALVQAATFDRDLLDLYVGTLSDFNENDFVIFKSDDEDDYYFSIILLQDVQDAFTDRYKTNITEYSENTEKHSYMNYSFFINDIDVVSGDIGYDDDDEDDDDYDDDDDDDVYDFDYDEEDDVDVE